MKAAAIICTYNRFNDLNNLIESLEAQSYSFNELTIVDASDEVCSQEIVQNIKQNKNIKYVKSKKGLPLQRNIGIEETKENDIICFFDDDVILDKEYLKTIVDYFYLSKTKNLLGLSGNTINEKPRNIFDRFIRNIFLITDNTCGKILISGDVGHIFQPTKNFFVSVLSGCNMCFRNTVFTNYQLRFDEKLSDYAYMEDQDFSIRVGRLGKLVQLKGAKLTHNVSPVSRMKQKQLNEMYVINSYYLLKKNFIENKWRLIFYWWRICGKCFHALFLSIKTLSFSPINGLLLGIVNHKKLLIEKKRKKILILLEATLGGIRKHVLDLILGLDKTTYDIVFIYSLKRADKKFIDDLKYLKTLDISLYEITMAREINPLVDYFSFLRFLKILIDEKPDLLHLHGAKAGALGRIIGIFINIKIVYTPHGGSYHLFNTMSGKLYYAIEKILSCKKYHYIGVSKDSVNKITDIVGYNENIHLIYNGISNENGATTNAIKRNTFNNNSELTVLFPALFMKAKGHLELIDAFGKYSLKLKKGIKILMAGDGPTKNEVKERIQQYNLEENFIFLGFVEDMSDLYRSCDVVLLPSISEALPYVILEAMVHSKPILASKVDAIPELITDGANGELFDIGELYKIVERLNYFMDNKDKLKLMGDYGRTKCLNEYSLQKMVHETEILYQGILHS